VRCWITRRLARDADAVVVTNAADAATLRAPACGVVVPYRHVHLIPIGSNIPLAPPSAYERQAWRARLGADDNTFLVAYFGLLSRSKGADVLLDALRRLRQADEPRRDVRLLLIGGAATTAPDRAFAAEVAQQIARSGLHEAVIRTGHVSEQEVSAHLLASDAVALPFREGASLRSGSLLAALGHGCAVVTTAPPAGMSGPADAVAELLHPVDGEHLLLVPADDSAALARALRRLADDTALRDRLGAGARALSARTGWEGIAQQHEQMYRQVWQG
jgi:glycosyltransferase involved in cell wall biosynthesis